MRGLVLAVALFAASIVLAEPPTAEQGKPQQPAHTNRLAKETSPYLLLHAHNPVDWYPWGEEALAKAKREKKLIFLSIGYSSCYWCHVMERESFTDDAIAERLNQNFVCIKVDREERPDLDEIYMQALRVYMQLIGSKQGGGWPLSMFLTPDAKPLMGGTYFPPRDVDGRLGFLTVIDRVREAWNSDAEKWQKTGDSLADYVAESLRQRPILRVVKLDQQLVDSVLRALVTQYDTLHAGFGFDPASPDRAKFPEPPNLHFLLDYARRHRSETARKMAYQTLERVSLGGIRDHIGGGFHRYSTDRLWRVPHFEKMLYDNAQLARVYAQAYELNPREDLKRAADETLEFILREMADAGGGFYSAIDAETDSKEGQYYVWTRDEVKAVLEPAEYELFAAVYGLDGEANFEERYIPLLSGTLAETAKERKISETELDDRLRPLRRKLLDARSKRARPLTDTKVLAGWNGLAIRGFADCGRVFKNERYVTAASRAADFVLKSMRDSDGRLLRVYAGSQAKTLGYLDDYAFLVDGLIALHQATGEPRWLEAAGELTDRQLELFWDERVGGFFYTSKLHEQLIARSKLAADNVTPSGNSVAAANLLYLANALGKPEFQARAEKCVQAAAPILEENPAAAVELAVSVAALVEHAKQSAQPAAK
ncbi:MAG TPA: thioredoxin domain-containing protein [Pirellulales bacterium]